jgi:hypothetical protein
MRRCRQRIKCRRPLRQQIRKRVNALKQHGATQTVGPYNDLPVASALRSPILTQTRLELGHKILNVVLAYLWQQLVGPKP